MLVHFSAPLSNLALNTDKYDLIIDVIKSEGHSLDREWIGDYQKKRDGLATIEWEDISTKTIQSVIDADVVILEATISSFSMGYLSALALAHRKPLLILVEGVAHGYIVDATNSLKRMEVYKDANQLREIIKSFLSDNDSDSKNMRFNMVLDRETYNLLNWESEMSGRARAQIIREIIKDYIGKRKP